MTGNNSPIVDRPKLIKSCAMSEYTVPESHAKKGRRLREVRKERGITLRTLASDLGISHPHLAYMETGQRRITRDVAIKAAALLDVGELEFLPEDLIGDTSSVEAQALFCQISKEDQEYVLRMMRLMRQRSKPGADQE